MQVGLETFNYYKEKHRLSLISDSESGESDISGNSDSESHTHSSVGDYKEKIEMVIRDCDMPEVLCTDLSTHDGVFRETLLKFMTKHSHLYEITEEPTNPRTRAEDNAASVDVIIPAFYNFIDELWKGIQKRFKSMGDISGNTSWSEAPAESVFSTWQFIIDHRQSLTVKHTEALCRIIRDGPQPATRAAEQLLAQASSHWGRDGNLRFTTKEWYPGVVSNIVQRLQK